MPDRAPRAEGPPEGGGIGRGDQGPRHEAEDYVQTNMRVSVAADSTQPPGGVAEGNGRRNEGKKEPRKRPRTSKFAVNKSLDGRVDVIPADTYIAFFLFITGNHSELSCW